MIGHNNRSKKVLVTTIMVLLPWERPELVRWEDTPEVTTIIHSRFQKSKDFVAEWVLT